MSPCCRRCLDAAAHWYPGKTVRTKGSNAVMEAPTSCAPVSGSASSKCARCVKNGKPCEPLVHADRPVLVQLFAVLAGEGLPETKAEYQDLAAVQAVRLPALRLLHQLKFGDKSARARTTAADAAAAAARTASEVAARAQLMELTQLQVQLDIANALRNITVHLAASCGADAVPLPPRVGPDSVPRDLDLANDDNEEE